MSSCSTSVPMTRATELRIVPLRVGLYLGWHLFCPHIIHLQRAHRYFLILLPVFAFLAFFFRTTNTCLPYRVSFSFRNPFFGSSDRNKSRVPRAMQPDQDLLYFVLSLPRCPYILQHHFLHL